VGEAVPSWGGSCGVATRYVSRRRLDAHCHIAERHEDGMMFRFDVNPADSDAAHVT